jgi:hypothetical protein
MPSHSKPSRSFRERMHKIGMAMFGPADSGPYDGTPDPAHSLQPRDGRGRLVLTCGCAYSPTAGRLRRA